MTRRTLLASLFPPPAPLNVLFLAVDDLNTDLGCYGHPLVRTPAIDGLARRGLRFDRAYCQYPVCNPSRTSLLSGLYPETTRVFDNRTNPHAHLPQTVFLPQHLRRHGYFTARIGKIYHPGMDGPDDWDVALDPRGNPIARRGEGRNLTGGKFAFFHWIAAEGTDEDHADGQITREAIRLLEQPRVKPFFLAVGFHKPHDPYVAPKRYFDLYPPERIPDLPPGPPPSFPASALPPVNHNLDLQAGREYRRAYWSCVSFMDAQLGKLLEALDRLDLARNTLVVFFGDHGLHLGEHGWWNKVTLFERSARVPLIVAGPSVRAGTMSRRVVELLDLYPTVLDWARLPRPAHRLAGSNLLGSGKKPARTVVTRGEKLGRSVRTERYRYTEWDEGRLGSELYDHQSDPGELRNLASLPRYASVRERLRAILVP